MTLIHPIDPTKRNIEYTGISKAAPATTAPTHHKTNNACTLILEILIISLSSNILIKTFKHIKYFATICANEIFNKIKIIVFPI